MRAAAWKDTRPIPTAAAERCLHDDAGSPLGSDGVAMPNVGVAKFDPIAGIKPGPHAFETR